MDDRRHEADTHADLLVTEYGKPFTSNGFGNKFRDCVMTLASGTGRHMDCAKADATFAAENRVVMRAR